MFPVNYFFRKKLCYKFSCCKVVYITHACTCIDKVTRHWDGKIQQSGLCNCIPLVLQSEVPLVHSAFRLSGYTPSQVSLFFAEGQGAFCDVFKLSLC